MAHAPVHLLPVEVRKGSTLFDRATTAGLVEGGFLLRTYRFADPRVEGVARVLLALPTRLALRSLPVAMYDLGYNLGIARVLLPELDRSGATATWERLTRAWNEDQSAVLRRAVEAARIGGDAVDALVREEQPRVAALDRRWISECDLALRQLVRRVSLARRAPVRAHTRGRLMGAVAFGMSLAACSSVPAPGVDAAAFDAGADGGSDAGIDAGIDAGVDAGTCGDGTPVFPGAIVDDGDGPSIDANCAFGEPDVVAHVDADGHITSFEIETDGGTEPPPSELLACLESFFAGYCYPSAAGGVLHLRAHSWIA